MRACILLLASIATASGNIFEDGMEYEFATETNAMGGTMDFAAHASGFSYKYKTRIQVSGNTLNVKMEDMHFSQYTGPYVNKENPFDKTKYTPVDTDVPPFSVTLDSNGLLESVTYSSDFSIFQQNVAKAWAQRLQLNMGKINSHEHGFHSKEKTIYGDCHVTYSVTGDTIIKSVSHLNDCENRAYRVVDDWRGHRCDAHHHDHSGHGSKRQNTDGMYSSANHIYKFEKKGDRLMPKAIVTNSYLVAQFFEEEGVSHMMTTNSTSVLVDARASSGDITASGTTTDDVLFKFEDGDYKWNKERDLKAREPFLGSGNFFQADQATLKDVVMMRIAEVRSVMKNLGVDKETIHKAHYSGINNIVPLMMTLDYDSLKSMADEVAGDKSEDGVFKFNVFNELLGSAGTSAAAMLIKDMLMNNKFDNYRDAVRIVSAVPFHLRHPNVQLLNEYEALLGKSDLHHMVKETIELVLGSMIRMTCENAGHSEEVKECFGTVGKKHVDKYAAIVNGDGSHKEKNQALSVIHNIRYGGIGEVLKKIIYGESDVKCPALRTLAIYAAGSDVIAGGHAGDYYMPVFANYNNDHEVRIAALNMIMYSNPCATRFNTIMAVLFREKDYEVLNYAFTMMESMASSIDPCQEKTAELAAYFLKYLKQYSKFEASYGVGISKTYTRQFQQKKYGYGGNYNYYVVGSHKSTTPLTVTMSVSSTLFKTYSVNAIMVHLRIQGLAKGMIRKFKKMDPSTWKMDDLKKIFDSDMQIRERPDQKIKVEFAMIFKGSIVAYRHYDEDSIKEGGNLKSFYDDLKGLGDTYTVNHQRVIRMGSYLYESPSDLGFPVSYSNCFTGMIDLRATVKKGNHRGLLFRDIEHEFNMFGQGSRIMMIFNPATKTSYGIIQDRVYRMHLPREYVFGVNPVKKELKISVKRPEYDEPLMVMMHSQNTVFGRSQSIKDSYDVKTHCPECENRVVVSKGENAATERVFIDKERENLGSYLYGKYFDCEMDVRKGRTVYHALKAFTPYNKNPKNMLNTLRMGVRQLRAYFIYFPRAEKCGWMVRWSQAKTNPVKEIEVSVRMSFEPNGERLFFRGRKWFIKALIKAKGEPKDRQYRINLAYEFTPGYLENNLKVQVQRSGIPGLMSDFSMCMSMENQYPDFSSEFLSYDKSSPMQVTGKARLRYGAVSSCDSATGEMKLTFKHETTPEAREDLKDKWYYKKCMEQKSLPEWSGRGDRLPVSEACYFTVWDATTARKYSWKLDFVKLTKRMNAIVTQFQSFINTGLISYWDFDLGTTEPSSTDPHLNLNMEFKDHDKALDVYLETSQGGKHFHDIPLSLKWYERMRNLKFTSTIRRLMKYKIINPCTVTSATVRTMDNVTYDYTPTSCWTLVSGHCSPNPSYAVFTKKSSGLPLAAKVYFGGHSVEFKPAGPKKVDVMINGAKVDNAGEKEYIHKEGGTQIFKMYKWGSSYNIYSFLKLWVVYDGHYINIIPAPSVKGQHCGMCGNYNRNTMDEFEAKDETHLATADEMVENYKWKC